MAYTDVSEMAADQDLRQRLYACAASLDLDNAGMWVDRWVWRIVASDPSWQDGWAVAAPADNGTTAQVPEGETLNAPRRGWDANVISDAMILERVRAVMDSKGAI